MSAPDVRPRITSTAPSDAPLFQPEPGLLDGRLHEGVGLGLLLGHDQRASRAALPLTILAVVAIWPA